MDGLRTSKTQLRRASPCRNVHFGILRQWNSGNLRWPSSSSIFRLTSYICCYGITPYHYFEPSHVDISGDIGPFQLAIALTIVALIFIMPWSENYGVVSPSPAQAREHEMMAAYPQGFTGMRQVLAQLSRVLGVESLPETLCIIRSDPKIWLLGLSQACFEGAIYTFGKNSARKCFQIPWAFFLYLSFSIVMPLPYSVYVGPHNDLRTAIGGTSLAAHRTDLLRIYALYDSRRHFLQYSNSIVP